MSRLLAVGTTAAFMSIQALAVASAQAPLSTLDPVGPAARAVAGLWWLMFWGAIALTVMMTGLGLYVGFRNPNRRPRVPVRLLLVGGGLVLPFTVVTGLLFYGVPRGDALLAAPGRGEGFRIEIVGHQWWWEVRYPDIGGAALHDANELHIPAGQPVDVSIATADVIHSFWVPRLGGKMDAIPGIVNALRIEADRPGTYRGQCAEFCGDQHARMGFLVHAHEPAALEERLAWLARRGGQGAPASEGAGAEAFRAHCAECHSIDSRDAGPGLAPNLAGVLARSHLGAGWMPNAEGAIADWIRNHHVIKPGTRMPVMTHLDDETVTAIVQFLEEGP